MRYAQTVLFLLLGLSLSTGAQPITSPADTVARWSGHGQVGVHWTEGTRDVVLFMAQHDLRFRSVRYEAEASVSGTASWTDIFTRDSEAARTQRLYRYVLDVHGQRALSTRTHGITTLIWLSDPNQGIERQFFAGAGAALTLNRAQRSYRLRTQVTGGYLQEEEVSGERLSAPAAAVGLNIELRLADGGQFSFHAEAIDNLSEPKDLLIRVRSSLTAPLGDRFGLTVSVNLSHDFLPASAYVEEDGTGTLVRISPSAFSAFVATGLSIQW